MNKWLFVFGYNLNFGFFFICKDSIYVVYYYLYELEGYFFIFRYEEEKSSKYGLVEY